MMDQFGGGADDGCVDRPSNSRDHPHQPVTQPTRGIDEGEGWTLTRRGADGELVLQIGRWSADVERVLAETGASHISQAGSWEDGDPVLPRLVRFAPQIRSLVTSKDPPGDLRLVNELTRLETLVLQHPDPGIDYARLASLHELRLWDRATVGRAAEAPSLRLLQLWSVKVKELHALASMRALRRLMLTQMGSLTSLEGIEEVRLDDLTISYGNRLRSLTPLGAVRTLRSLSIDGNNKVRDVGVISGLTRLEVLQIENGPALPDVETLGALRELRDLEVIGTAIGTGPSSAGPLIGLTQLRQLVLAGRPRSLKNLTDVDALGELRTLELLRLDRIADLPAIGWVRALRRLKHLAISGTRILDRDLSPAMDLPALTFLALDLRGFGPGGTTYTPSHEEVMAPSQARRARAEAHAE